MSFTYGFTPDFYLAKAHAREMGTPRFGGHSHNMLRCILVDHPQGTGKDCCGSLSGDLFPTFPPLPKLLLITGPLTLTSCTRPQDWSPSPHHLPGSAAVRKPQHEAVVGRLWVRAATEPLEQHACTAQDDDRRNYLRGRGDDDTTANTMLH